MKNLKCQRDNYMNIIENLKIEIESLKSEIEDESYRVGMKFDNVIRDSMYVGAEFILAQINRHEVV